MYNSNPKLLAPAAWLEDALDDLETMTIEDVHARLDEVGIDASHVTNAAKSFAGQVKGSDLLKEEHITDQLNDKHLSDCPSDLVTRHLDNIGINYTSTIQFAKEIAKKHDEENKHEGIHEELRDFANYSGRTDLDPWVQGRDVLVILLMIAFWLASLLLPERRWSGFANQFAYWRVANADRLSGKELETIRVVVGKGEEKEAWIKNSFRSKWLAHKYLSWIQLLACYRPRRWRPRPRLIGRKHLDGALARGRGVILLTAPFAYKDLMTKVALAEAGYWVSHLVQDSHGFAESRLGKALLNPIYVGVERRFLRDRLVFSGSNTREVNKLIRERLRENRLIQVTVTPLGRRVCALPFLHGRIRIATGALNFACEAGAAVLPLFTVRNPDGSIETIIEHELTRPPGVARGEAIQAMLDDYVPRLETYVAQYPEQFSFPISGGHDGALIVPWASPARTKESHPSSSREELPEFSRAVGP